MHIISISNIMMWIIQWFWCLLIILKHVTYVRYEVYQKYCHRKCIWKIKIVRNVTLSVMKSRVCSDLTEDVSKQNFISFGLIMKIRLLMILICIMDCYVMFNMFEPVICGIGIIISYFHWNKNHKWTKKFPGFLNDNAINIEPSLTYVYINSSIDLRNHKQRNVQTSLNKYASVESKHDSSDTRSDIILYITLEIRPARNAIASESPCVRNLMYDN